MLIYHYLLIWLGCGLVAGDVIVVLVGVVAVLLVVVNEDTVLVVVVVLFTDSVSGSDDSLVGTLHNT